MSDAPTLDELIPLFPTKADAKRYRKEVLKYVAECERDAAEIAAETARIKAMFPERKPLELGYDFLAYWHELSSGGTAIRRKRRRELKKLKKQRRNHDAR